MFLKNSFSLRSQYRKLSLIAIFMSLADLLAQDADIMVIGKLKFHMQNAASGAVPEEIKPYGAFAFIGESSPGSILSIPVPSITPPGLPPIDLEYHDGEWNLDEVEFDDKAILDTTFPNGNYTVNFTGATSGPVSGNISIEWDAYPNAPSLTGESFNALHSGSLSNGFTLEWVPFQNGTINDGIVVRIEDIGAFNGNTLVQTEPFDMNGLARSMDIPAGLLSDDGAYEICIYFFKVVYWDMIGGGNAFGLYESDNCVELGEVDTSRAQLFFNFWQDNGSFNEIANNQVTTNIFPLSNQQYSPSYNFEDDAANFPDKNVVTFGAPAGSPFNGAVPNEFYGPDQGGGYGVYHVQSAPVPTDGSGSGTYSVSFSGVEEFSKEVDFPLLLEQYLIVIPSINLNGDNTLQSIDFIYKDSNNQNPSSMDFIRYVGLTIYGLDYATLYEEWDIPVNTTNIVPSSQIAWGDVQGLNFSYNTDLGNHYSTGYDKGAETGDNGGEQLYFGFWQDSGSFNEPANNQVTTNIFPLSNQQYNPSYSFDDDAANFPDKSVVTFGAPAPSPFNGAVPDQFYGPDQGEGFGVYHTQSAPVPNDGSGLSGTYSVSVSDEVVLSTEVDFALVLEQNLIVIPSINLNGDNTIQSIDFVYKDSNNQNSSSLDFIRYVGFSIYDLDYSNLYEEYDISLDTTNIVPSSQIAWSDVHGLNFSYNTDMGNHYGTSYDKGVTPVDADIFGGTDIESFPGWKGSPWYLNYNVDFWPWIYHDEHGWQFVYESAPQGTIYVWDPGLDAWLFLTENTYRWIFMFGENPGWIWCFDDNTPTRRFFQRFDDGSLFAAQQVHPLIE